MGSTPMRWIFSHIRAPLVMPPENALDLFSIFGRPCSTHLEGRLWNLSLQLGRPLARRSWYADPPQASDWRLRVVPRSSDAGLTITKAAGPTLGTGPLWTACWARR
jgi:hypothetical protein